MLYAFKLGPIQTDEGKFTTYVAVRPDGQALPAMHGGARDALEYFAQQAEGAELFCEPQLAFPGKPFGFAPTAAPEWAAITRAVLAFGLGLGAMAPPANGPIADFLEAVATFTQAAPWKFFDNGDVIDVRVSIGSKRATTYEGCIMGAGGQEFGLALYKDKGAIARLESNIPMEEARKIDSLAVTLDHEPRWAVDAIEEAFDLPAFPFPIRLVKGRAGPARAEDLKTLTVSLLAIAKLHPENVENELTLLDPNEPGAPIAAHVQLAGRPSPSRHRARR